MARSETPAFSLICLNCDAGMDVRSRQKAEECGWHYITEDDGLSWNFLGVCPDCWAKEWGDSEPADAKGRKNGHGECG